MLPLEVQRGDGDRLFLIPARILIGMSGGGSSDARTRATIGVGVALAVGCGAPSDRPTARPTSLQTASASASAALPDQAPPPGAKRDVVDVTVDGAGACAILSDGRVACWGPGPLRLAPRPKVVPGVNDARSASLVGAHLYVTHANGDTTLHSPTDPIPEHPVAGGRIAFLAGDDLTCSLRSDANLTCFARPFPGAPLVDLSAATALAVGKSHACFLQAADGVLCLGANGSGQLGVAPDAVLPESGVVTAQRFAALGVSAGDEHSCAIASASAKGGDVHCWGGPPAALGRDATSGTKVAGVSNAVTISSGGANTCVLDADGVATCWGVAARGARASDAEPIARPPARVAGVERLLKIAVGEQTCAVTAGMRAFCWGAVTAYTPSRVPDLEGARALSVVGDRSCVEGPRGATCWGEAGARTQGRCAIDPTGSVTCERAGASTRESPGVEGATALAIGTFHACALRKGGEVACWGDNYYGQLGAEPCGGAALSKELREILGDTLRPCMPAEERARDVEGITDAVAVAAGGTTTCALLRTGDVHCWGSGPQLGPRDLTASHPRWASSRIEGVQGAIQISVGGRHACARSEAGGVTCWGAEGHKPYNPRTGAADPAPLAPVRVPIDDAIDIASGELVTCAVRKTGHVTCWGEMDDATRGGAEDVYGAWIFDVLDLRNVVRVGVGDRHACALTSSERVYCWGHGELGQLGDGSGAYTPREVEIVVE